MILDYSQYISVSGEEGIVNFKSVENTMDNVNKKLGYCPFCKTKINNRIYYTENNKISWCRAVEYESVNQCPKCGWWEHKYTFSSDDIDEGVRATSVELSQAVLRRYDDNSKTIPIEVLNKYITENPDKIYGINDRKMEELVACVFKDFHDCEIKLVGKSHDGGKDLILIDGEEKTFVQVKRRTQASKVEPVSSIRDLIGASIIEDAKACIFVSTADHFSRNAVNVAEKVVRDNKFDSFELIDYHRFVDMLNLKRDKMPNEWEKVLKVRGEW